jgi:predicted RNA-binding protein with PIN domain
VATHRVVDGNNVMGARPDGWWRDRAAAKARLVSLLQAHARQTGEQITVFFDGRPVALPAETPEVRVRFAPGAADAADDAIVRWLSDQPERAGVCVVSSDAGLLRRLAGLGVASEGAGAFRRRLDAVDARSTRPRGAT